MPTSKVQQAMSGRPSSRWMLPCFFLWGLNACDQDTVVEVSVLGLSPAVTLLHVSAECHDGSGPSCNGSEQLQLDFQKNLETFYVTIPASTGGTLSLDVKAQSGEQDFLTPACLVSSAKLQVQLTSSFIGGVNIDLELKPLKLAGFQPDVASATGGTTITLSGQGFTAETVVKFDSSEAEKVGLVSPCQLTAILPPNHAMADSEAVVLVEPSKTQPMPMSSAMKTFHYLR